VALSDKRFDAAAKLYAKLLKGFPDSPMRGRRCTTGSSQIGSETGQRPSMPSGDLSTSTRLHADAKDALFQVGACYAEQANWPASAEVFARVLERSDLSADDRIEALARRGLRSST